MLKDLLAWSETLRGADTVQVDVTIFGLRVRLQKHSDNRIETLDLLWTKTEICDVRDEAVLLQDVRRAWDNGRSANAQSQGLRPQEDR